MFTEATVQKECKIDYHKDSMTFNEARRHALERTWNDNIEVAFYYNPEKKDEKEQFDFFIGNCGSVKLDYVIRKGKDGVFHTHPYHYPCLFSVPDLLLGSGKESTLGCIRTFSPLDNKMFGEFRILDLRNEAYTEENKEKIEMVDDYMTKWLDRTRLIHSSKVVDDIQSKTREYSDICNEDKKCLSYKGKISDLLDSQIISIIGKQIELEDEMKSLHNKMVDRDWDRWKI